MVENSQFPHMLHACVEEMGPQPHNPDLVVFQKFPPFIS